MLTGGETMLKYDEFFLLTSECLRLGLFCAANTNASLINDNTIPRILEEGSRYLVISLDSHIEDIHVFSRGINESYQHAVSVLKKLVALKKRKKIKNGNYYKFSVI